MKNRMISSNSHSKRESRIPIWVYLSFIFMCALFLRLAGIWRTEPIDYHADEWVLAQPITKLANNAEAGFIHHYKWSGCGFIRPVGYSLYALKGLFGPYSYNSILIFLRVLSALTATATVIIAFVLLKKLVSIRAALLASVLVAVANQPVLSSHYGTLDSITSLIILTVMWLSFDLFEVANNQNGCSLKAGRCCIVGLLCGWGIAIKWTILLAAIPITVAFCLSLWSQRKLGLWQRFTKINLQRVGIIAGISALSFLASLPDLQLVPQKVIDGFKYEMKHHKTGHYGSVQQEQSGWNKRLAKSSSIMEGCGNIYLAYTGLAAMIFTIIKPSKQRVFLLTVMLLWLFVIIRNVVIITRHHLVPFILMLLLIATMFDYIWTGQKKWLRITGTIVYISLTILAILYTCINTSPFWKPDARIDCANWIKANVPIGSGITWAPRTYTWMAPGKTIAPWLFELYPRKAEPGKTQYIITPNRRMRTFKKHPPTRKIIPSEWFPAKPPTMTELILYAEMNNGGGPNLALVKEFRSKPSFLGLDLRLFGEDPNQDTSFANQAVTLFRFNN